MTSKAVATHPSYTLTVISVTLLFINCIYYCLHLRVIYQSNKFGKLSPSNKLPLFQVVPKANTVDKDKLQPPSAILNSMTSSMEDGNVRHVHNYHDQRRRKRKNQINVRRYEVWVTASNHLQKHRRYFLINPFAPLHRHLLALLLLYCNIVNYKLLWNVFL